MSPRKLDLALTLGIVLEVLEILRRTPTWLLFVVPVFFVVYAVVLHPWWTAAIVLSILVVRHRIASR